MEVTTNARAVVEASVANLGPTAFRFENGDPDRTMQFLNKMVAELYEMTQSLGQDFDVTLHFGTHGVSILGETK